MDFLEGDAIAEEVVSVLRKELSTLKARELALNDRLTSVQVGGLNPFFKNLGKASHS
jgi:hypothetical protein